MSKSREKIAVGLRLRNDSLELLHWVITTTARPDDHVIALHYLDQSSSTVTAAGQQKISRFSRIFTITTPLKPF
jgi:hypothetical protein